MEDGVANCLVVAFITTSVKFSILLTLPAVYYTSVLPALIDNVG